MSIKIAFQVLGSLPYADGDTRASEGLVRYAALFAGMEKVTQQVAEEMNKKFADHVAKTRPFIVHLRAKTDPDTAQVTVLSKTGDIHLKPTEPGHYQMRLDPKLMKENPWVQMSLKHGWSITTEIDRNAEPEH